MTRRHDLVTDFVRECAQLSSRFEEIALIELLALLAVTLAPIKPSVRARERLLAAISGSSARFAPFFGRLSSLFDLRVGRVEEIMARVPDPASWEAGPLPGLMLMHFEGGPRCADADVGLVRLAPGFCLPPHRHRSLETAMILEGGYREDTGRLYLPGDVHEMTKGTVHSYRVLDERPCLLALVLFEGVEFLGE
jgi:putative transcriptional regulator